MVVAAAKRFGIEPFLEMDVPKYSEFRDADHRNFQADLDHYITQLMIDNSIRARRDTTAVSAASRDRIRAQLEGLRECVEKATLSEAKRNSLLELLRSFELELDKRRVSLLAVTRVALEILALPGGVWASADIAQKLVSNVMKTVAEESAADDERRRLSPSPPMKALLPPRRSDVVKVADPTDDLDDMPF